MLTNSAMRNYLYSLSPSEYIFETPHNVDTWYFNIIARVPVFRRLVALILIRAGYAIMRVTKVNPLLPVEFKVSGWKVRNRSQRHDGVLWTAGGSVLLTPANVIK